jgi:5-hydroxyisourate hydrolase
VPEVAQLEITTHVLDTVAGDPARGVPVSLARRDGESWRVLAEGRTDGDGRWGHAAAGGAGDFRLVFDVAARLGPDAFFPEAVLVFRVTGVARRHYHVPLLLSRFGYTTYRGS